jgi:hypothetical protein
MRRRCPDDEAILNGDAGHLAATMRHIAHRLSMQAGLLPRKRMQCRHLIGAVLSAFGECTHYTMARRFDIASREIVGRGFSQVEAGVSGATKLPAS